MKKTYGQGSAVFVAIIYLVVLAGYCVLMSRLYTFEHYRHTHARTGFRIYVYAVTIAAFAVTVYYFISRFLLHYHKVIIEGESITIKSLIPLLKPITERIDNISRIHFIANRTRPELTVVTPNGEMNFQLVTNYLVLVDLYAALIAHGVPVYISGPSARFFKMDRRKIYRAVFIIYLILGLIVLYFALLLFHVFTHHHPAVHRY